MLDNDDDDDFVGVGVFGIEIGVVLPTEGIYSLTVAVASCTPNGRRLLSYRDCSSIGGDAVPSVWMLLLVLSFRCHCHR